SASDEFDVNPFVDSQVQVYKLGQSGPPQVTVRIDTLGIGVLALHGLDGDDVFNLNELDEDLGQATLPYSQLIIDGGNPSASDVVNLSNPPGPVVVNLGNSALSTDTTITGYGGTITLQGDEVVNLGLGGQTLTLNGTSQPENISYAS